MKRLDRFILKSFVGPFIAILLVVIFIFMMQFLWVYIDELVGKGLSLGIIAEFLLWGSCTMLPYSLPLATLLAAMMTVGQMAENNELIAIKSAGIPLTRTLMPLFVASALISIGAFYASNDLVPYSFDQIYTLRDDIGRTKGEINIPSGTFYDGIDGYTLRVESQDRNNGMMHKVMVYDHTGNKGNTTLTLADSAMMKMSKAKDYLTFTLYHGANYQETNTKTYRDTTLELQRIGFDRQELIIRLENYNFEKSDSARYGNQVKSMNLKELKYNRDSLTQLFDETHEKQVRLMLGSTSHLRYYSQMDTAFAEKGLQPFRNPDYLKWDNLNEKARDYSSAAEIASQAADELITMNREIYEYQFYLRRMNLDILKKFAGALACLILFFIGAPLGALIRKGGLGSSAIVSVLFFVLYYIADIVGSKLAKDGAVGAAWGAFFATAILLPIGAFLSWKAVNDSSLSDMDQLKIWWRSVKSKFMSIFKKTRIVYMGTPEFAVAPLDALIQKGYKVVGVVTVADKPAGRGLKVNESAVKKYAVEHGIPVLQPVKLKDPEFLEALKAWKADLFVVVAFRMLPEEVWRIPRLGTFNLHAALLPQYRGAAPINWAVINGEKVTGVTTFMIDKNIDTGGIILRQECRISPEDTAGDVHDRLMEIGANLVCETVQGIIEGNVETRVQRSFIQGSEVLKPAPKLTRELCHIDWSDSTRNILNLIRGLSPYPTAYTEFVSADGTAQQVKIFSAAEASASNAGLAEGLKVGQIASDGKSWLAVGTADGAVEIRELQLAGKKRMDVKTFLLGFREPSSYTCSAGTSKAEIAKTRI